MSNATTDASRDWLSSKRTNLIAWWIPLAAILALNEVIERYRGQISEGTLRNWRSNESRTAF